MVWIGRKPSTASPRQCPPASTQKGDEVELSARSETLAAAAVAGGGPCWMMLIENVFFCKRFSFAELLSFDD